MTDYFAPTLWLAYSPGSRADAERVARQVAAEHGLTRRQVRASAANGYGGVW